MGYRLAFILLAVFSTHTIVGQQPQLVVPSGHSFYLNRVLFTPDNRKVLTLGMDRTVKVWETKSGLLIDDIIHPDIVDALAICPDGSSMATGSRDGIIRIRDLNLSEWKDSLAGHHSHLAGLEYNKAGDKLISYGLDSLLIIWDIPAGKKSAEYHAPSQLNAAHFTFDNEHIIISTVKHGSTLMDMNLRPVESLAEQGSFVLKNVPSPFNPVVFFPGGGNAWIRDLSKKTSIKMTGGPFDFRDGVFSPDGTTLAITGNDSVVRLANIQTGRIFQTLSVSGKPLMIKFNATASNLFCLTEDGIIQSIDLKTGQYQNVIEHASGYNFDLSMNSRWLVFQNIFDAAVANATSGSILSRMTSRISLISDAVFIDNGQKILINQENGFSKVVDLHNSKIVPVRNREPNGSLIMTNEQGRMIAAYGDNEGIDIIRSSDMSVVSRIDGPFQYSSLPTLSNDGTTLALLETDSVLTVISSEKAMKKKFAGHFSSPCTLQFSKTGRYLSCLGMDGTLSVFDLKENRLIFNKKEQQSLPSTMHFSPSEQFLAITSWPTETVLIDLKKRQQVYSLEKSSFDGYITFTNDSKHIIASSGRIYESATGKFIRRIIYPGDAFHWYRSMAFTKDGNNVLVADAGGKIFLYSLKEGKILNTYFIPGELNLARFSPDETMIMVLRGSNTVSLLNTFTGKELYSLMLMKDGGQLVLDSYNHFDGDEQARKELYLNCGDKLIFLDQIKDQLWVPDLASRVMRGEKINSAGLNDLNVCGVIPEVDTSEDSTGYRFRIKPGSGGIGETHLFVNKNKVRTLLPTELSRDDIGYSLFIPKQQLQKFFVDGESNRVSLKVYARNMDIASRMAEFVEDPASRSKMPPNLYAIMVGVSDYKGPELDLSFAAKDASDLGQAIKKAASKLLNTDGREHVFIYDLVTSVNRYKFPEKNSVHDLFREIGKKAGPNDILLIFFAGHGVMRGPDGKKQFYFLTADASANLGEDAIKQTGISMAELTEWIQPDSIRAQKRVLIFDACNSGQAITDIAGKELAVRDDTKAEQLKLIDKLNERSGLFILSAAASSQSAYEMSKYAQGLLTYSLLKCIKEKPDILDNGKLLNLSKWFNAATNSVTELASETGARQEPQMVSNTNFSIGLVDEEVLGSIHLPMEKKVFTISSLRNADERIDFDNIGLSDLVNTSLRNHAQRSDAMIAYNEGPARSNTYFITGRYLIQGGYVAVKCKLVNQGKILAQFDIKGNPNDLTKLAEEIALKSLATFK